MHYPGMQIEAVAEALSEAVGFRADAGNPNVQGWQDIVEFLFQDERIKTALIERYGDRISDYADRIDAEFDRERDADQDRFDAQRDRRMEGHWARLAEAITRQEARRLTEGSR